MTGVAVNMAHITRLRFGVESKGEDSDVRARCDCGNLSTVFVIFCSRDRLLIYDLGKRKVELRGDDHWIADNATVIGTVILEHNTSVWFNAVLRGDNEPIHIGENTNIQDGAVLHTDIGQPLTLGKNVTVGHQAMVHGCQVDDNSLIGINAVLLNGAKIGKNCLIAANTLILEGKEIPEGSLVMGSPGKVVRPLTAEQIEGITLSAMGYVENFKRFKKQLKLRGREGV